jgi:hypothetical protein
MRLKISLFCDDLLYLYWAQKKHLKVDYEESNEKL